MRAYSIAAISEVEENKDDLIQAETSPVGFAEVDLREERNQQQNDHDAQEIWPGEHEVQQPTPTSRRAQEQEEAEHAVEPKYHDSRKVMLEFADLLSHRKWGRRRLFLLEFVPDFHQELFGECELRSLGAGWLRLTVQLIDLLHHDEDTERDDDEVDDGLKKCAVFDDRTSDRERKSGEVDFAEQYTNERHQDIIHERCDDLSECTTNDDTHGEIDNVSFHGEASEFFDDGHRKGRKFRAFYQMASLTIKIYML